MHPITPAAPTTIFARTPALRGKTDLLDFGRTIDWMVYEDSRSPVLKGIDQFDNKIEQLMPFIRAVNKQATFMGWNNKTNPQQITMSLTTVLQGRSTL